MQFAIPQFTDTEDHLIGRLTLKQFLVLLVDGGFLLFLWSILGISLPFFILALPIGFIGIAVALGRYNGRPMFSYTGPFLLYAFGVKAMIFKREPTSIHMVKSEIKKVAKTKDIKPEDLEPKESRLKKLAYLLDQKATEEDELTSSVKTEMK